MRIVVIGAGVIGSVYAGLLSAAGHDVRLLARGSRKTTIERDGVRLRSAKTQLTARPRIITADQLDSAADLTIVAVRATQLFSALELLDTFDSSIVAFLQHLGEYTGDVRLRVGDERTVLAFPGIGGQISSDGSIEFVEIAAQPTTIDKTAVHAETFRTVVASTGMRTAMEADMPAWYATHAVFVACVGAGILACGGEATALAGDRAQLRSVVQAIREGFAALDAAGTRTTPTALRVLFSSMPQWFAAAYWRRALRGPVGTIAIAPHTRASRDDEFATICTNVLAQFQNSETTPVLIELLTPWAAPQP